MGLNKKQKKYIRRNIKKKDISEIALHLNISEKEINLYFKKKIKGKEAVDNSGSLKGKILNFNFRKWFDKNILILIGLTILVFTAYINSLGNDFVSDDIAGIVQNQQLDKFAYTISGLPTTLRLFIDFLIVNIFGRSPVFFRLVNIFFHLGSVLVIFLLINLMVNRTVALFAAAVLAVHPLQTEAVTWISGGLYSQYSFFIVLALLFYVLSVKDRKYYYFSIACFVLSLMSSEKAIVFPFLLFVYQLTFRQLKNWKKLIVPFVIGGSWALFYVLKVPERISSLETQHYQTPRMISPLFQVPVALGSYIELAFFPKGLTLYHSEMLFSRLEFAFKVLILLAVFGLIYYGFKRNRQLFFWPLFFIVSLFPVLTPFGISWIVAERYVYLGAIGIFVTTGLLINLIFKKLKLKNAYYYAFLSFVIPVLLIRTIFRNNDWKNQDNLWLAAAKYSPSSAQNHNNLGDLYGRRGDLNRAAEEFKTAIQLQPNYADAYHNLANTYSQLGETDKAIQGYQEAFKFNPNLWQSYQNLGGIYFNLKDFQKAEEYFKKALKLNYQSVQLHTFLTNTYLEQGKNSQAREELIILLRFDPNNQEIQQALFNIPDN